MICLLSSRSVFPSSLSLCLCLTLSFLSLSLLCSFFFTLILYVSWFIIRYSCLMSGPYLCQVFQFCIDIRRYLTTCDTLALRSDTKYKLCPRSFVLSIIYPYSMFLYLNKVRFSKHIPICCTNNLLLHSCPLSVGGELRSLYENSEFCVWCFIVPPSPRWTRSDKNQEWFNFYNVFETVIHS